MSEPNRGSFGNRPGAFCALRGQKSRKTSDFLENVFLLTTVMGAE
jgi:hypothetical protein